MFSKTGSESQEKQELKTSLFPRISFDMLEVKIIFELFNLIKIVLPTFKGTIRYLLSIPDFPLKYLNKFFWYTNPPFFIGFGFHLSFLQGK